MIEFLKKIKNRISIEKNKIQIDAENKAVKKIMDEKSSQRIYHYHIRKTAGTTINFAFLNNAEEGSSNSFYDKLVEKPNHRLISPNKKIFVGWNVRLINEGNYFYAFSHNPIHKLKVPADVFTITCLRDPLKRVVSHYNMLKHYEKENIDHPCMKTEGLWLGNSFDHFIDHIPQINLLNQIYMFSESFDLQQAFDNISRCSFIMFTETLEADMKRLEGILNLDLPVFNEKKYDYKEIIPQQSLDKLREKLEPEYKFMEMVMKIRK
jgi:hypothetical protein